MVIPWDSPRIKCVMYIQQYYDVFTFHAMHCHSMSSLWLKGVVQGILPVVLFDTNTLAKSQHNDCYSTKRVYVHNRYTIKLVSSFYPHRHKVNKIISNCIQVYYTSCKNILDQFRCTYFLQTLVINSRGVHIQE